MVNQQGWPEMGGEDQLQKVEVPDVLEGPEERSDREDTDRVLDGASIISLHGHMEEHGGRVARILCHVSPCTSRLRYFPYIHHVRIARGGIPNRPKRRNWPVGEPVRLDKVWAKVEYSGGLIPEDLLERMAIVGLEGIDIVGDPMVLSLRERAIAAGKLKRFNKDVKYSPESL